MLTNNKDDYRFVTDEELTKLDNYKSLELIKAINECNMYVQNGAVTTMMDFDSNGKLHIAQRNSSSLYRVMEYVNNESIPRDALLAVIHNLYVYVSSNGYAPETKTFNEVSFAIGILQGILNNTTQFAIYICKKPFTPKSDFNIKVNLVEKGDVIYLVEKAEYLLDGDTRATIYTGFNTMSGTYIYLYEDELKFLKTHNIKNKRGKK